MISKQIKKSGLTTVEEDVLEMVVVGQRVAISGRGYPPSHREIMGWMGWRNPVNVAEAMDRLERKGYIRRSGIVGRGRQPYRSITVLRVLDGGLIPGECSSVP